MHSLKLVPGRSDYLGKRQKKPEVTERQWKNLKDIVTYQKVGVLKRNFIEKARRNNPYSKPVEYSFEKSEEETFLDNPGIELKESVEKLLYLLSVGNILGAIFLSTLSLVFEGVQCERGS